MKLSNKSRYGIRAVFDIAYHNDGKATQIRDIAERQSIPPRFLEQIFQDLKRIGIISSKRGPQGGYHLTCPPKEIRLGDIVRALEGPISLSTSPTERHGGGDPASRSVTDSAFKDLSKRVEACFDAMTVGDLCERGEQNGVRRKPFGHSAYAI